jgi:hypothetical protein
VRCMCDKVDFVIVIVIVIVSLGFDNGFNIK